MKHARLLLPPILLIVLLSVAFFVRATCNPADTGGAGNDTITCDLANQPATNVEGLAGDDTILVDSGVTASNVSGGNIGAVAESGNDLIVNNGNVSATINGDGQSAAGNGNDTIVNNGTAQDLVGEGGGSPAGSGNDTIINNGIVVGISGDSYTGTGSGSDNLVNNGTADGITGDSISQTGSGNDQIVNNGNVTGNFGSAIYGDSLNGAGTGNDTIVNNGIVNTDIYGDTQTGIVASGNDTIVNSGTTNNIYGDNQSGNGTGSDIISNSGTVVGSIVAGGGSDTVIIQANLAQVGGTIDGGAGYDVLTFNLTSTSPEELQAWADQIYAANPAGGTLTFNGHTYTWTNFEELTQLLFSMSRINEIGDPLAVFCSLTDGVDVYAVRGGEGFLSLTVSSQTVSNGLEAAAENGALVQIGNSAEAVVYATDSGTIQVNAPNGFSFVFVYQNYCGSVPQAGVVVVVEEAEEEPLFTIINQPYGG